MLEAATVDGANGWQKARYITLPMLMPVFAYITIVATAGSLTAYDVPYVFFSGSGSGFSGPAGQGWFFMPYIVWMAFNQFRMGYATAIGWLVFIIAVALRSCSYGYLTSAIWTSGSSPWLQTYRRPLSSDAAQIQKRRISPNRLRRILTTLLAAVLILVFLVALFLHGRLELQPHRRDHESAVAHPAGLHDADL